MKPIAWFDPSNGVVSTDRDSPLFTPLGQVWPLYPKGEWVGMTKEEAREICMANRPYVVDMVVALEARLKQKNGYDK